MQVRNCNYDNRIVRAHLIWSVFQFISDQRSANDCDGAKLLLRRRIIIGVNETFEVSEGNVPEVFRVCPGPQPNQSVLPDDSDDPSQNVRSLLQSG